MKKENIKIKQILRQCLADKANGVLDVTKEIDGVDLKKASFNVPIRIKISKLTKQSIDIAYKNIFKFHSAEMKTLKSYEKNKIQTSKELICWKKFSPIERVGIYIPNNLFSSALMNIIPALIAGNKEIIICTPPFPSNEILYVLQLLKIRKIYTLGGAQAIFAMAYGLGGVPKVDKIFGPGNQFVNSAKKMISNETAIDMPAGPSEVLIIADSNANVEDTAFDLLAQLEHGSESKAWLISESNLFLKQVYAYCINQIQQSERKIILKKSIQNMQLIQKKSIQSAIFLSNQIAPEHLILNVKNPEEYISLISNAGSVFLGSNTTESLGDYLSGTNHVLPTSGFSKSYSGLSVSSFGKFTTFQKITKKGLGLISKNVINLAESEKLFFHAQSVKSRLR